MSDYEPKCRKTLPIIFDDHMSVKNLLPKIVNRVNDNTADTRNLYSETESAQGDIEDLQEDVEDLQEAIAPAYSATSTYAVGAYVMYNNVLYRCVTAIQTAEAWTAAHWTEVNVGGELTQYKEDNEELQNQLDQLDNGKIPFHPNTTNWYRGYFNSTGEFVSNNSNAAPTNTPFAVPSNSILMLQPNGLIIQVQTYSYSGGTYTRVSNINYEVYSEVTIENATYMAIHVRKSNGSTLPLDEVTSTIDFKSNIQKSIDAINESVSGMETFIGNETMGTTASTITGAIAEHENDINELRSDIKMEGWEKGLPVTIQKAANAANFKLNSPSGRMYVESTNAPIFTGTINNIDLLNLKQGVFTDTTSGVTIEITGNEVYIHGTTTAGFRFDFQNGTFYTDSFANHPANLDILPAVENGYKLCYYAKSGYTMPSNIYIAVLNKAGTIAPVALNGCSAPFYKNGTYIALYSNEAITGINVKFTLGLKVSDIPGTIAGIEAVAKSGYNTTIIQNQGAFVLGELTWTGDSTVYNAVELLKLNDVTKNHVFVWFGDSISQLKELPVIASKLIGAPIYDCTFAGAPLTYGDPTKYQPTGFMSLAHQIVTENFSALSDAIDAQQTAGIDVTEKRVHMATLQALDFDNITDIVVFAGTNDFDNDYVNSTNFVSGFTTALTELLTAYPQIMVYVIAPIWRGDKTEGVQTIPTMNDLVELEETVAGNFNLPFYNAYKKSGINSITASVYLENDLLHPSAAGDDLLASKCAKFILSN